MHGDGVHLSHDPDCAICGHSLHIFLPCECGCVTSRIGAAWDHDQDVAKA